MHFNWTLKKRIVDLYLSQSNFGRIANVSDAEVSQVIRGRKELPLAEQERWALFLKCRVRDIFRSAKDK
jgi:hypothetical protein